MRGTSKLAVASTVLVAAGASLLVLPLASGAGQPKGRGAKRVTILGATQNTILKRGLRVRLPAKHRRGVKVKATSTTFDDQSPARLAKVARARGQRRVVRLKLTGAGKAAIRSCEARRIQVR